MSSFHCESCLGYRFPVDPDRIRKSLIDGFNRAVERSKSKPHLYVQSGKWGCLFKRIVYHGLDPVRAYRHWELRQGKGD